MSVATASPNKLLSIFVILCLRPNSNLVVTLDASKTLAEIAHAMVLKNNE